MKNNFAFNKELIGNYTDKLIEFHRCGKGDYLYFNPPPSKRLFGEKLFYCPFCGAKIEFEKIRVLWKKKVSCEEIIEPERIIPAKTKKVCKYEWVEVK